MTWKCTTGILSNYIPSGAFSEKNFIPLHYVAFMQRPGFPIDISICRHDDILRSIGLNRNELCQKTCFSHV